MLAAPLLSSLNSGEFSPRMEARVDFEAYPNACRVCRNFLLLPQGGITRRSGSRFVKEVKDSSASDTDLIPFEFSQDQAYMIEAGDAYMRFYRRQARLECADISASIANGTFASDIASWTDPTNAATPSYIGGTSATGNLTTYTFATHSIGAADANRLVVVCISGVLDASTARSISTVTIGGSAAAMARQTNDGGSVTRVVVGIAHLRVQTGTAATIEVTFSGAMARCRIDVYRVIATKFSARDTNIDTSLSTGALSAGSTTPFGGCVIAAVCVHSETADVTGFTWTSATEGSDSNEEDNTRVSTASASNTGTTETTVTATATRAGGGGTEFGVFVIASYGFTTLTHDATNLRMVLEGTSIGPSHAEQAVTITETSTEHTLRFRIQGHGGGTVKFRVGTSSAGTSLINDYPLGVGEHSITFTPGAATIYIGFINDNSPLRDMYLDNVAMLDNVPFELITPYATADLANLRFFQAADVAYLAHPSYAPRRLERRGHKSWSIVEAFFEDGPYLEVNPGTDLDALQLILNPFFENGIRDWTRAVTASVATTKVEAPDGSNYVKMTIGADADSASISQDFTAVAGVPHVLHLLFTGADEGTNDLLLGDAAGGTEYLDTFPRPKWTSRKITPTGDTLGIRVAAETTAGSPLQWHAALCYPQTAKLIEASAKTGEVTVTAYGFTPFVSTDVGRLLRLEWPGKDAGYGVITAYTSTSVVTVLVLREFAYASVPTEKWRLGAWCTAEGFPQVIGFADGRLFAANNTEQPQTVWGSQSGDFQNMRPDSLVAGSLTVEDDDALVLTLNSRRINPIVWFAEQNNLIAGTIGGPWVFSSDGAVLTPLDAGAKQHSATPAASKAPVQSDQAIIFLDRSKREVYDLAFTEQSQSYVATLLTIMADHILRSPGVQLEYQRRPHSILWVPRADGRLATLSYNRQHEILGWSQQIMGGVFGSGNAIVESVAVIPGADDDTQTQDSDERDEVWVIVKRTINGATKRYIEVFERAFEGPLREDYSTEELWLDAMVADQDDGFYVDSGITYAGASTSTISGLTHLEGQTVKVLADGKVHPDCTVSSGAITLNYAVVKAQVGLAYTSKFESLKLSMQLNTGTGLGRVKSILGTTFAVHDCGNFKASVAEYDQYSGRRRHDLQNINFRRESTAPSAAVPLASGETYMSMESFNTADPRIYIETDLPLPCTILAMAPQMRVTAEAHTT